MPDVQWARDDPDEGAFRMTEIMVPPWIPADPKILCVGQSPAYEEADKGRPFVGTDGRQLQSWLAQVGADPYKDVAYTNVVQEFRGTFNYKPTSKEIKDAHHRVMFELVDRVFRVSVVVLVGGPACKMMWPGKMSEVQGQQVLWPELDFPVEVFGCWHPGAYRNARSEQGRRVKENDILSVLARAWNTANGRATPTVELPDFEKRDGYDVQ